MAANDLVTGGNLDTEFDINGVSQLIGLRLGTGLQKNVAGEIEWVPPNTIFVDQTFDATFNLTNADIHNNGAAVQMVDDVLDAGWARTANQVTFLGVPEKVTGFISVSAPDAGASNYWSRPKMRVSRNGTQIAIIDDLVMQQNGTYDGDAVINGVFFDKSPGNNPTYTFEWFDQENRTATLPPRGESQIALEATVKVEVYAP